MFTVGFSNAKGWLTIGVCLVVPQANCLTQVWLKQAPRRPLQPFSPFLLSLKNQAKFGCLTKMRSARPVKLLFIVPTPLHHLFVSHAQSKTMYLCLAMCFSAYKSRFSCAKDFEKVFSRKTYVFEKTFVKSCGSLSTALQGGTFSFAPSIFFTALPMHCCCTIYQGKPGSFCITLFWWSALANTFQPKDTNNYFGG